MKIRFILLGLMVMTFASQAQSDTLRTAGGMPYVLFASKAGKQLKKGNHVKYHAKIMINDSVVFNSYGHLPAYTKVGDPIPYDASELWTKLKVGDSVIAVQVTDTFFNRSATILPPWFKRGTQLTHYIKVLGVFATDAAAVIDNNAENKKTLNREVSFLQKYLADKKVITKKTPSGVLVQIIKPGTGSLIIKGKQITVNYTGRTLDGTAFDSNTDSAFQHVTPVTFVIGKDAMMKGFEEGLYQLRPGSLAKIYIPSMLAYGANPNFANRIKPYEHLVFEVEILSVKDK